MRFSPYMTEPEREAFLAKDRFYYVKPCDDKAHSVVKGNLRIEGDKVFLFGKPFEGALFDDFREALRFAGWNKAEELKRLNAEDVEGILQLAGKIAEIKARIDKRKKELEGMG